MKIALAIADGRSTVVAKTADNRVLLSRLSKKESMFDDEASWEATDTVLDVAGDDVEFMLLDKEQRNLYLASRQSITVVDVGDASAPAVKHKLNLVENGQQITSVEFLNGENSCWSRCQGRVGTVVTGAQRPKLRQHAEITQLQVGR